MNLQHQPVALRQYLAGQWVPGNANPLSSHAAADPQTVVATGSAADKDQVQEAFSAASSAQTSWAQMPMTARAEYLKRAAAWLREHVRTIGEELSREEGKTLPEGIGEVTRAAQILEYYAGEPERVAGTVFHSPRAGEQILVTQKPLGVVAVISPFNFPIAIPAWKIAPALIYGNTVVFKPASLIPLLALRLVEAFAAAQLPAGVLNLLIGPGGLGDDILAQPELAGVSFTGSTGIGRSLCAAAAERGIPVQAEMGGKNAAVVLADANLELAVEQVLFGAFRSTGQKYTATSRLILDEQIADEFLDLLYARLDHWITGDPLDPQVHMGPLVDEKSRVGVQHGIEQAIAAGAIERYRGSAPDAPGFMGPVILELPQAGVAAANPAWHEEFFAPVLTVLRVSGIDAAFAAAEDSQYGLALALFTRDLSTALRAQEQLDVGILHVNSESAGADPHVPFGGAKFSGYGPKEQGGAAREFYTHTTTTYLRGA